MKHSIRITGPNGAHVYLSHRGKSAFAPSTARKYLAEWKQCNPGGVARIETQDREPVENEAPLGSKENPLKLQGSLGGYGYDQTTPCRF